MGVSPGRKCSPSIAFSAACEFAFLILLLPISGRCRKFRDAYSKTAIHPYEFRKAGVGRFPASPDRRPRAPTFPPFLPVFVGFRRRGRIGPRMGKCIYHRPPDADPRWHLHRGFFLPMLYFAKFTNIGIYLATVETRWYTERRPAFAATGLFLETNPSVRIGPLDKSSGKLDGF